MTPFEAAEMAMDRAIKSERVQVLSALSPSLGETASGQPKCPLRFGNRRWRHSGLQTTPLDLRTATL